MKDSENTLPISTEPGQPGQVGQSYCMEERNTATPAAEEVAELPFKCPYCGLPFEKEEYIYQHIRYTDMPNHPSVQQWEEAEKAKSERG